MRFAAYLRVSSIAQAADDRYGLERQRNEISTYAESVGATICETFKDAITGRSATRTGLTRLKEAAGDYDAIISSSVDRLGRDVGVNHRVLAELLDLGLAVHAADFGAINLQNESSLIQFNLRSLFSHLERLNKEGPFGIVISSSVDCLSSFGTL